jgi:hypothetical protein
VSRCAVPRGGRREGRPGVAYASRTDLQAVRTGPSQQYGQRVEQERSQRVLPLAGATSPGPTAPPTPAPAAPAGPPAPLPGQVVSLGAPSARPDEPVTSGMAMGLGAGPEALGPLQSLHGDVNEQLRAIYSRFPNEDLRRVLEMIDTDDGSGLS